MIVHAKNIVSLILVYVSQVISSIFPNKVEPRNKVFINGGTSQDISSVFPRYGRIKKQNVYQWRDLHIMSRSIKIQWNWKCKIFSRNR